MADTKTTATTSGDTPTKDDTTTKTTDKTPDKTPGETPGKDATAEAATDSETNDTAAEAAAETAAEAAADETDETADEAGDEAGEAGVGLGGLYDQIERLSHTVEAQQRKLESALAELADKAAEIEHLQAAGRKRAALEAAGLPGRLAPLLPDGQGLDEAVEMLRELATQPAGGDRVPAPAGAEGPDGGVDARAEAVGSFFSPLT